MEVSSQEPSRENPNDQHPLLMEQSENHENRELTINVGKSSDAPSSGSSHNVSPRCFSPHPEDRPSSSTQVAVAQSPSPSPNASNSRSSSLTRRAEELGHGRWSPFNTMLWVFVDFVFTLGQIIAAIVVLSVSRHEKPRTPLFAWVVGYTVGCIASLPLLYWRYLRRNQATEQGSAHLQPGSSQDNTTSESNSYITLSLTHSLEEEGGQHRSTGFRNGQTDGAVNTGLSVLVDHFRMALDCFFAVWFVVGNVWIFGGHSSASDVPKLYRLCLVFLAFSCIGYAMPFILCGMICCCLPCIISFLGVREDMNGMRGASEESINALPTHKFKLNRSGSGHSRASDSGNDDGGFLEAGTEKERSISGEDAVCCICLARYVDDDALREMPCSHFFHTACVDKWLKINASCPLCKFEIGNGDGNSPSAADASQQV